MINKQCTVTALAHLGLILLLATFLSALFAGGWGQSGPSIPTLRSPAPSAAATPLLSSPLARAIHLLQSLGPFFQTVYASDQASEAQREENSVPVSRPEAAGAARTSEGKEAPLAEIQVSFKLDPRLTKGLYMGDRWISPPRYTGAAGQDTIEARTQGLDADGRKTAIDPEWVPSDPDMITVSPSQGREVAITVKRAGESRLRLTAGTVSKELAIEAEYKNEVVHVEIAQLESKAAPAEASAAEEAPAFKNEMEKLSYALGANVGNSLRQQSIVVDPDLLVQGFKDAMSGGEMLLSEDEVRATLLALQTDLKSKQAALQAEKNKELAEKNRKSGEAFLAGNKDRAGVVTLESGLQYKVLKAGDGAMPAADDIVVCQYRGTLIDGTEFDSSFKRNKPATLSLKRVIKGWSEALQLMPVGSKWQLFVPSDLAYGVRGALGKIGPHATLIFEVELLSIKGRDHAAGNRIPAAAQRQAQVSPQ